MTPIKKTAVFLMLLGAEKGQNVIALMDSDEIKTVISEINKLTAISPEIQNRVWAELEELGYDDELRPFEVLTVIRFLFNGRKIGR